MKCQNCSCEVEIEEKTLKNHPWQWNDGDEILYFCSEHCKERFEYNEYLCGMGDWW